MRNTQYFHHLFSTSFSLWFLSKFFFFFSTLLCFLRISPPTHHVCLIRGWQLFFWLLVPFLVCTFVKIYAFFFFSGGWCVSHCSLCGFFPFLYSGSKGMDFSQRRKMKGGIRLRRESVEWERKVSIKTMNPTASPSWQVGWVELTTITLAGFGGTFMPCGPLSSKGVIPGPADTLTHFHWVFQCLPRSYV